MAIFDYRAVSTQGKNTKGIVEAENAKAARLKLKKQGLMVTDISERTVGKANPNSVSVPFFSGRASSSDVAMMTRQLASLVKANIPLVESLNALSEQVEKPVLKVALSQVRQDVNEGLSLAKAMAKHPRVFDSIFINMIEAGESSGTLGLVLLKLADLKEAQMRLRGKISSGMMYPGLMLLVAVGLMTAIFTFVIPEMTKIFAGSKKPLPLQTKILIETSSFFVSYWYLVLTGFVFGVMSFLKFKKSETGKPKWDAFTLKVPLIGNLVRLIAVTRFASTMSTLLSSGVPIVGAMNIARNLVGNVPIANAIQSARDNITEGQSIAEPLRRSGEFPPMVLHMIAIGEKTGALPEMLRNIAETYEEQVNTKIDGLTALLEPMMIVGMGGMVGFIVISIFIPLMEMSNIN